MSEIDLVIKIPEKTYRQIQALARNGYFEHDICGNSMRRIANGISLPKGHGDLKDIDAINLYEEDFYEGADYERAIDAIVGAPTIIEADKN